MFAGLLGRKIGSFGHLIARQMNGPRGGGSSVNSRSQKSIRFRYDLKEGVVFLDQRGNDLTCPLLEALKNTEQESQS